MSLTLTPTPPQVSAIISLIKCRTLCLDAELPVVVQAVLRPLDPSVPSLREGCLAASTTALRELFRRYPQVAFHQLTQRLAVGTTEGVVIIYDLRTATKWRILQGHEAAVSALAFSASGEHIASVSMGERSLRWWLAGSHSFFSFLGLTGSCVHTTNLSPPPTSATGASSPVYGIEWTSANEVRLICDRQAFGTYAKPP